MEKDSYFASTVTTIDGAPVTVPIANDTLVIVPVADGTPITVPSIVTNVFVAASASVVPMLLAYAKPFHDIYRIEICSGQNFKRW